MVPLKKRFSMAIISQFTVGFSKFFGRFFRELGAALPSSSKISSPLAKEFGGDKMTQMNDKAPYWGDINMDLQRPYIVYEMMAYWARTMRIR